MNTRVRQIEDRRAALLFQDAGWLKLAAKGWGIYGSNFEQDLRSLNQVVRARVWFRRDPGGPELVKTARETLMSGGDCEDQSLILGGGLLWATWPEERFASVYYPDATRPIHVALYAGGWVWDPVRGSGLRRFDGEGELVWWEKKPVGRF